MKAIQLFRFKCINIHLAGHWSVILWAHDRLTKWHRKPAGKHVVARCVQRPGLVGSAIPLNTEIKFRENSNDLFYKWNLLSLISIMPYKWNLLSLIYIITYKRNLLSLIFIMSYKWNLLSLIYKWNLLSLIYKWNLLSLIDIMSFNETSWVSFL